MDTDEDREIMDSVFVFDDNNINDISNDIVYGHPFSLLITGYRGVGKTSFVNRLQAMINKKSYPKKTIFLNITLSNYENYSLLLRLIFRKLYIEAIPKISHNTLKVKKTFYEKACCFLRYPIGLLTVQNSSLPTDKVEKLCKKMNILYDSTFFKIDNKQKNLKEKNCIKKIDFNIKRLIASLFTTATALLLLCINRNILNPSYDILFLVIAILWTSFECINYASNEKSFSSESYEKNLLFDAENLECHLEDVLKNLNLLGYRTVISFDELDKINDNEKLQNLLKDLKPLILSNLTTSIFISGQSLFYDFFNSRFNDDDLLSSIFSNTEHIGLQKVSTFVKIFNNIILDTKNKIEEKQYEQAFENFDIESYQLFPYKAYIESKILESNRIARRFINLLRQDIVWENDKAFIKISNDSFDANLIDAKLLYSLTQVEEELKIFSDGIKDFLIIQLHIWIQKMKLKRNKTFTLDALLDASLINEPFFISINISPNDLIKNLLEKMIKIGLIKHFESTKERYSWVNKEKIKFDSNTIKSAKNIIEIPNMADKISIPKHLINNDLSNRDLSEKNLSGFFLDNADLSKAFLDRTNLSSASLKGANFSKAILTETDLTNSDLTKANLSDADLTRAKLIKAQLTKAILTKTILNRADLSGAKLNEADLSYAKLDNAKLSKSSLIRCKLIGVILFRTDLTSANLTDSDLSDADLSETNLRKAVLSGANLSNVDLRWKDLNGNNLSNANLEKAQLFETDLSNANLSNANLIYANMTRVNLTNTNLDGADLRNAVLTGARLDETDFSNADLRGTNLHELKTNRLYNIHNTSPSIKLRRAKLFRSQEIFFPNIDLSEVIWFEDPENFKPINI